MFKHVMENNWLGPEAKTLKQKIATFVPWKISDNGDTPNAIVTKVVKLN